MRPVVVVYGYVVEQLGIRTVASMARGRLALPGCGFSGAVIS